MKDNVVRRTPSSAQRILAVVTVVAIITATASTGFATARGLDSPTGGREGSALRSIAVAALNAATLSQLNSLFGQGTKGEKDKAKAQKEQKPATKQDTQPKQQDPKSQPAPKQ